MTMNADKTIHQSVSPAVEDGKPQFSLLEMWDAFTAYFYWQ
jgi:hypothetical protein